MNNEILAKLAVDALKIEYPNAICSLTYNSPVQMLIATRLSAQCTDARVNTVTPALFKRFPTAFDFANADVKEVEEYICPCGLYKTKSRDIINMCRQIIERYNGEVPDTMEDLTSLPGVGRKTANLVLGDIFGKPAVVVDTHFIRITRRLGFHDTKDPFKIETIMRSVLPENESNDFCHRVVIHGRNVCTAKNPKCEKCCMKEFCKSSAYSGK
mgnify:FL=1